MANYKVEDNNFYYDVKLLDGTDYQGKVDMFVGGSPCQSFSIAGARGGFEDTRGTLFREYARIIKECEPKVFIFENVQGLFKHDGGKTWEDKTSWLSYNKDCFYIDDWESYDFDNYKNVLYVDGESMYPSVARNIVNGKLSIGWQQDYFAGCEIKENNAAVAVNSSSIYFTQVDAASIGSYNNTKEIPQGMWTDSTGVADNTLSGMKLYPNPASSNVNIAISSTESGNATLAVFNLMGQMVYSENVALAEGNNLVKVSVSDLNAGVYMINIKTSKGTSTQKLVVR